MMNVLILLLGILFFSEDQERKDLIIFEQKIQVSGSTSLGRFNCDFSQVGRTDTLWLNSSQSKRTLEFLIPIKSFSCGNFMLNNDFRSTLKADQYPFAKVVVKNFREKSGTILCHLALDLVGQQLEYPDFILEKHILGWSGK
ncbi:MAG TPA: hypothetical protein VLA71_09640, partial [Algoriphagus sp.]|nr:hypothetical protein [Algoriphagus sp.]